MAQTERIQSFSKFQAASVATQIATNPNYTASPEMFKATSGTGIAVEPTERKFARDLYRWTLLGGQHDMPDEDTSASALMISSHVIKYPSSGVTTEFPLLDLILDEDLIHQISEAFASQASAWEPIFLLGQMEHSIAQVEKAANDLSTVVDYALRHGLKDIADRLVEINEQPLDEDELALQASSAMNFVKYCIARKKRSRPLMTATPTGDLDATWKSRGGHQVVMRFFPSGSIWVAFSLSKVKGSFQVDAVRDLLELDTPIKIPDWA